MRISQERRMRGNERMSSQRPNAPNSGGSDTARDLALNYVSDPRNNSKIKGNFVRNFRQQFKVPENVLFDFSVNEAI